MTIAIIILCTIVYLFMVLVALFAALYRNNRRTRQDLDNMSLWDSPEYIMAPFIWWIYLPVIIVLPLGKHFSSYILSNVYLKCCNFLAIKEKITVLHESKDYRSPPEESEEEEE